MNDNCQLVLGDCLDSLRRMAPKSVNCCITSPPYFGLRDYGHDRQIGLEPTPDEFVGALVAVFREVRRVLRDDGTLWLNLGDSYWSAKGASGGEDPKQRKQRRGWSRPQDKSPPAGIKRKDLIGIPWRVALALQADGWYLRQDIIWSKPNAMPDNAGDRCSKSHEYIFLLSKSPRYHFDSKAIMERAQCGGAKNKRSVWSVPTKAFKGAHFATFPPGLIEPCVLSGCPEGGVVLDPFGGSGTTAGVALAHGRRAILCELNPDYAGLVDARVNSVIASIARARAVPDGP